MLNNLQNLVVFINDEAELQQALIMLVTNEQNIGNHFYLSDETLVNYLYYEKKSDTWNLSFSFGGKEITLTELEQKLKEKHGTDNIKP